MCVKNGRKFKNIQIYFLNDKISLRVTFTDSVNPKSRCYLVQIVRLYSLQ